MAAGGVVVVVVVRGVVVVLVILVVFVLESPSTGTSGAVVRGFVVGAPFLSGDEEDGEEEDGEEELVASGFPVLFGSAAADDDDDVDDGREGFLSIERGCAAGVVGGSGGRDETASERGGTVSIQEKRNSVRQERTLPASTHTSTGQYTLAGNGHPTAQGKSPRVLKRYACRVPYFA